MKRPLIGEILRDKFNISNQDILQALEIQKKNGGYIGQILIQLGSITESQLLEALSEQLSIPIKLQVDEIRFQEVVNELSTKISLDFFYKSGFLPFDIQDNSLLTLTTDPLKIHVISKLEQDTGLKIKLFLTYDRYIKSLYRKYIDTNSEEFVSLEEDDPEKLKDMALEVPVIKYLNDIITRAVELNASDIHIEPQEKRFIVRFRIDGVLHEMDEIDENFYLALTSRIKLLSGLDIAEKRLPQDGKFSVRIGSSPIDIRTSTIPTVKGEDVVIRLLYRGKLTFELDKLGIKKDHYDILVDLIKRPYGMILVTGPTGSGKTTTLYSVLSMLNSQEDKIITIEDPVEYQIEGLNQIQIKPEIGLTFASALRSILRHDPDIIMVGEIRDKETAEISIQSALTGHLVFSTLHTNDAPSSLFRLLEMDIEDYLINASILGIVAQRIVRTNCPYCSEPVELEDNIVKKFKLDELSQKFGHLLEKKEFRKGKGCDKCANTGYRGRIAIYELFEYSEDLKEAFVNHKSIDSIKNILSQKPYYRTLREDGFLKVIEGITTIEEVLRIA
ncbi:GspE/PulE family protein [Hydrogenobaculum sp.]